MAIDNSLVKNILQQLEKKYPLSIESSDNILPEYKNRNEILNHLFHCIKSEWVEATPVKIDQRDIPVEYKFIRLTEQGKNHSDFLLGL